MSSASPFNCSSQQNNTKIRSRSGLSKSSEILIVRMCLVIRPGKYHSGSNPRNAPPAQRINSAYWSRWSHSTAPPGSAHASLVLQCMHSTLAALSGAPIVIKGSRVPPLLFGAIVGPCHRFTAPPLPDLAAAFLAQPSPDIDAADVVRCLN